LQDEPWSKNWVTVGWRVFTPTTGTVALRSILRHLRRAGVSRWNVGCGGRTENIDGYRTKAFHGLHWGGVFEGYIGSGIDITERRDEEELREELRREREIGGSPRYGTLPAIV
jgi:hypothetical protein